MATKIDIVEKPVNLVRLSCLMTGDTFLLEGDLYMVRARRTAVIGGSIKHTGETIVTKMSDGSPMDFSYHREVEPVDIEIKVVRK